MTDFSVLPTMGGFYRGKVGGRYIEGGTQEVYGFHPMPSKKFKTCACAQKKTPKIYEREKKREKKKKGELENVGGGL